MIAMSKQTLGTRRSAKWRVKLLSKSANNGRKNGAEGCIGVWNFDAPFFLDRSTKKNQRQYLTLAERSTWTEFQQVQLIFLKLYVEDIYALVVGGRSLQIFRSFMSRNLDRNRLF